MSKAVWLVDMGYVVKAAKLSSMRIDYVAAQQVLVDRYGPTATFLFNSYDTAYGIPAGLTGFYTAMKTHGMVVRLHPMSGDALVGTHKQRRVDVDLACYAVWQASKGEAETVVLTTGDQDMVPLVEMCRSTYAKAVVLFTFVGNVSQELKSAASEQILFEDFRSQVELG